MKTKRFYFLHDKLIEDFPEESAALLINKGNAIVGNHHDRPCYYVFTDENGIHWMIPLSSQLDKYHKIFDKNVEKRGYCNSIIFENVLGHEKAFLLQNMFPVTDEYIREQYTKENHEVKIRYKTEILLEKYAKRIIKKARIGVKNTFTNIMHMEQKLLEKKKSSSI